MRVLRLKAGIKYADMYDRDALKRFGIDPNFNSIMIGKAFGISNIRNYDDILDNPEIERAINNNVRPNITAVKQYENEVLANFSQGILANLTQGVQSVNDSVLNQTAQEIRDRLKKIDPNTLNFTDIQNAKSYFANVTNNGKLNLSSLNCSQLHLNETACNEILKITNNLQTVYKNGLSFRNSFIGYSLYNFTTWRAIGSALKNFSDCDVIPLLPLFGYNGSIDSQTIRNLENLTVYSSPLAGALVDAIHNDAEFDGNYDKVKNELVNGKYAKFTKIFLLLQRITQNLRSDRAALERLYRQRIQNPTPQPRRLQEVLQDIALPQTTQEQPIDITFDPAATTNSVSNNEMDSTIQVPTPEALEAAPSENVDQKAAETPTATTGQDPSKPAGETANTQVNTTTNVTNKTGGNGVVAKFAFGLVALLLAFLI
jgi:hypothetical protein